MQYFRPKPERTGHNNKRYGLTVAEVEDQWRRQAGLCLICGKALELAKSEIDHDHGCCCRYGCRECVRALLHHACNSTLGKHEASRGRLSVREHRYLQTLLRWHVYLVDL